MRKGVYLLVFLAVSGWMADGSLWPEAAMAGDNAGPASEAPDQVPSPPSSEQRFAYDIDLHNPEQTLA